MVRIINTQKVAMPVVGSTLPFSIQTVTSTQFEHALKKKGFSPKQIQDVLEVLGITPAGPTLTVITNNSLVVLPFQGGLGIPHEIPQYGTAGPSIQLDAYGAGESTSLNHRVMCLLAQPPASNVPTPSNVRKPELIFEEEPDSHKNSEVFITPPLGIVNPVTAKPGFENLFPPNTQVAATQTSILKRKETHENDVPVPAKKKKMSEETLKKLMACFTKESGEDKETYKQRLLKKYKENPAIYD